MNDLTIILLCGCAGFCVVTGLAILDFARRAKGEREKNGTDGKAVKHDRRVELMKLRIKTERVH